MNVLLFILVAVLGVGATTVMLAYGLALIFRLDPSAGFVKENAVTVEENGLSDDSTR